MAYLPNQEQDQDQQGGIGQQGQPAQSVQQLSTGSGANLGGANLGAGQNIQQSQPDSPTGFTNINRYLDENRTQGQQMADSVTSNALDTANTAASTIRDTGDVFNKNVESQRVNYDPTKFVNNTQVSDNDIKWAVNDITTRHGGMNQPAPQVSDNDIKWAVNDITTRHGGMNDAAANEIYNTAKQKGVTADRLEQFVPGAQNWLQQQGKTLNAPTTVTNQAAANEIYNTAKQHGVTADRLEQFLPGTQNWLQQQGKTLNDPTKLVNNKQVTDGDIKWAINDITARHGGMNDAAANEIYNLARQNGVTADRLEQFLPGTQNWLQQQGKTLNAPTTSVSTDATGLFLQAQQIANDPARMQEFLRQRDAQYTGLGSIEEDYDSVNKMRTSLSDVENISNMLRSDAGRGTLAARLNPEYSTTAGMSSLDNMLFADEAKQAQLYNTLNQIENMDLQGIYDNVVTGSKSIVDQVREANRATRENTGQLLDTTRDIYGNAVNQNVSDALSNARGIISGIQEKLRTNQRLTPDEVNRLGITMDDYNQIQDAINHNNTILDELKNKTSKMTEAGEITALTQAYADAVRSGTYDPDIVSAFEYVDPSLYINTTNAADAELYARQQALFNLANQDEGFNLIGNPLQTGSYMDQLRGTYNTSSVLDTARSTRDGINSMTQAIQDTTNTTDVIDALGNGFNDFADGAWKEIRDILTGKKALEKTKDVASSAVSHTKDAVSSAAKKIKKLF